MTTGHGEVYEFGDFRVDAEKRLLVRRGQGVSLTPKVFETLLHLLRHREKTVDKNELMQAVWPDTAVEENNLNQNISTLRRVLGEARGENRFILTLPGKGYRFVAEVRQSRPAPEAPEHMTLAVLPFENLSADLEREYLADGLTEETISALGQIEPERLSVIGRTSVMRYKRTTKTLAEIGDELNASYLVEGTIRAEGGRLRITAKLIRVRDQVQVWSASYDSEPSSVLVFQRELSGVIAEQVRLRLAPERLLALGRRQTQNAQAYDLYLRGRHFWNQLNPATTKRATEFFARATEIDPKYALAWSGIADSYSASPINGDAPPLKVMQPARDAAARAVEAEPNLAEAQTSLGFVKFWLDWEWLAAEAAFRKAIELDPNYPMGHRMLGILLAQMCRHEEARNAIRRARELDPLVAVHHALSAQVAFAARDFEAAVQFARQAIVVDPEFWIGHFQLGQAFERLEQNDRAMEAMHSAGRFSGGNSKVVSLRGYILAKLGHKNEARETLQVLEAIAKPGNPNQKYVPPYAMAQIHCGLGESETALAFLEEAYEVHDVHLALLAADPKWDPLRSHPRFSALLHRCAFFTTDNADPTQPE